MHWRLQKLAAATWSHTQYRFRREAWTMDAVYVIKRLAETFRTTRSVRRGIRFEQYNRTLYMMFEDLVKAFDSVNRELLTIVERTATGDLWSPRIVRGTAQNVCRRKRHVWRGVFDQIRGASRVYHWSGPPITGHGEVCEVNLLSIISCLCLGYTPV